MRRLAAITALTALALAAGACDGDGGGGGAGSSGDLVSGRGYSVEGALGELPDASSTDRMLIQTGDLEEATELAGLERPADEKDPDALVGWIGPLTGQEMQGKDVAPVFVPMPSVLNVNSLVKADEVRDELGWSVVDVDSFVEQSTPPKTFAVVSGDFDDDTLDGDLAEVADGVVTAGEGDDLDVDYDAITAARPLGQPLRLSQDGHRIAASPSTSFVEDWAEGADKTLADDEDLESVAEALDDQDAVSAVLATGPFELGQQAGAKLSPSQLESLLDEMDDQLVSEPFDAVGIGWGVDDDDEAAITVAYRFADDDAAKDNVGNLENLYRDGESLVTKAPLSDRLTLEDVTADDEVVSVSLSLPEESDPSVIYKMLQTGDLPFVHG